MYNPYSYQPYSTLGNSRNQFTQSQQQQYDFSGWGDRLTSIEEGIKSLRDQFQNINVPGEEFGEQSTAPEAEYAGNTAPPPLAAAPPAGGIPSIPVTPGVVETGAEMISNVDPLAPTTPTALPESLTDVPATPTGRPDIDPSAAVENTRWHPSFGATHPNAPKDVKGNQFDWGLPIDWDRIHIPSITQDFESQYRKETGGPLFMGEEWDARQKEMGFDFTKGQYLKDGEWTNAPMDFYSKGHEKYKPGGTSRMNQLFEEAGGVLDRPEMGAATRYGEGFTKWLGDKGYQVYTEPPPDYLQYQGLGAYGRDPLEQDTSGYIPHLSQYAMTAEEMQDPTGTIQTRRDENARKHSEALNQSLIGRGIDPEEYWGSRFTVSDYQLDPVRDAEQIASQQGETPSPERLAELSAAQQQGTRATDLRNTRETPGAAMTQADLGVVRSTPTQPFNPKFADKGYTLNALSNLPALQGPTQKKIQQGLGAFAA